MDVVDINSLGRSVLWATFAITFLLGALMQKTGFCSMGAVSDIFIMSSWDRLKQWCIAYRLHAPCRRPAGNTGQD
jgi:hypothetical protein